MSFPSWINRARTLLTLGWCLHTFRYSRHISDAFFDVLRAAFTPLDAKLPETLTVAAKTQTLKNITEVLDDGEGAAVIPEEAVFDAIAGYKQQGVRHEDHTTWICKGVKSLIPVEEAVRLVESLKEIATSTGKNLRKTQEEQTGVDLDEFMWASLRCFEAAIERHQHKLQDAFSNFDKNSSGLNFVEFGELMDYCCGDEGSFLSTKEKGQLFSKLEAKDNDGDESGEEDIDDPNQFAAGIVRSLYPMAVPSYCRNYWRKP